MRDPSSKFRGVGAAMLVVVLLAVVVVVAAAAAGTTVVMGILELIAVGSSGCAPHWLSHRWLSSKSPGSVGVADDGRPENALQNWPQLPENLN